MAPSKLKISSCLARTPSLSLCGSGWPRWTRLAMCSQLCRSSNYPRTCLCQTDFALRHADCQAGGEGREGKSSSSSAAPTSFARRQWLLGAASRYRASLRASVSVFYATALAARWQRHSKQAVSQPRADSSSSSSSSSCFWSW